MCIFPIFPARIKLNNTRTITTNSYPIAAPDPLPSGWTQSGRSSSAGHRPFRQFGAGMIMES